ncbi:MAG: thioredoxin domain-containing protein [Oligoflexia bacterium]|nr:thioredoxin domain-containing protein [Oligoflexia bacterium]
MNNKTFWFAAAVVGLICGLGVSAYLVMHHYDLMHGLSLGKSFCSLNSHLDCDAVNTSRFSEFLGIPVALWGFMTYLVQLIFLFGARTLDNEESQWCKRIFFYLSAISFTASLLLAAVSAVIIKSGGLMCMALYVVSIITFASGIMLKSGLPKVSFLSDWSRLRSSYGTVAFLAMIPIGSFLANGMLTQNISSQMDKLKEIALSEWSQNKKNEFNLENAPRVGSPTAPMQIVEFFDFQCGHCRRADPTLMAFYNANREKVSIVFQSYPLDPACNKAMQGTGGHGLSCPLAKAAQCAHGQGKFLEAKSWIFNSQDRLKLESIQEMATQIGLNKELFDQCLNDPNTDALIREQVDRGITAQVQGTPTLIVNGRYLPGGATIPVLQKVLDQLSP